MSSESTTRTKKRMRRKRVMEPVVDTKITMKRAVEK
jgi:hypothetical protein